MKANKIEIMEVGATKFRSIVGSIESGEDLVMAKKTKNGVKLSVLSGKTKFFVIDSLAKDVITAKKRILFMGEEAVRLSFWAQKGGYGDNCAVNFVGSR